MSLSTTFALNPFGDEYNRIKSDITHFTLASTVSEMLRFEIFNLENLGQGHGVQYLQWRWRWFDGEYQCHKSHN